MTNVLWLRHGAIAGDDTDGHVDQLARFVGPRTVVAAREENPSDENFKGLRNQFALLESMTDQDGRKLTVEPLPLPRPKYFDGHRLPACYLNFYIVNGAVIVPQFDDPADEVARSTLARLFPDREVIGLDALQLIWGLGAFHCLSQQEPCG